MLIIIFSAGGLPDRLHSLVFLQILQEKATKGQEERRKRRKARGEIINTGKLSNFTNDDVRLKIAQPKAIESQSS